MGPVVNVQGGGCTYSAPSAASRRSRGMGIACNNCIQSHALSDVDWTVLVMTVGLL
jgi:hypothetical protein